MIFFDSYRFCATTREEMHQTALDLDVPANYFTEHPTHSHYVFTTWHTEREFHTKLKKLRMVGKAKWVDAAEFITRAFAMNLNYRDNELQ
jgi:hypothetical protein